MKNKIDWQNRIVHSEDVDSFNLIVSSCEWRFREVNEKLPWIEPSINMIHLDAVKSYVFGSSLSSISSSIFLLEHSLRMGIWDENNAGSTRKRPTKKIMNNTFGDLLKDSKYEKIRQRIIPNKEDRDWWDSIRKAVRNKVAHINYPQIFRIAKELDLDKDYAYSGFEGNAWNPDDPHSWGMFWHRYGDKLASDILKQAVSQIKKLINNTSWKSDESCWISQKTTYEAFFVQNWDFTSLKKSLQNYYRMAD